MHTYTLILFDPDTQGIIDSAAIEAEDRNDALRHRPSGWLRHCTSAQVGLVPYVTG